MEDQEKLRKLQLICIDILFTIDDICRKHNLTYYLAYGTLLGAVRHKGFIPWDDDIDIYMPRKDMEKLISDYSEDFKDPYRINHYASEYFMSNSFNLRIGSKKAQVQRIIGDEVKSIDVWVSVFPIDDCPNNILKRKILDWKTAIYYTILRLVRSAQNGTGQVERSFKERIGILFNKIFPIFRHFQVRDVALRLDHTLSMYCGVSSKYKAVFSYNVDPLYYKAEWFADTVYLEFEGRQLPCPIGYDKILSFCYGEYLNLPPVNKQKPAHGIDVVFRD